MGRLLGHAVRFGAASGVMAVGEGIETMLSLRAILPALPLAAALSANHLAAFLPPSTLRRLYIARDNDPAGYRAVETWRPGARAAGVEAFVLAPTLGDFNDDLRQLGPGALATSVRCNSPRKTSRGSGSRRSRIAGPAGSAGARARGTRSSP